MRVHNGLVINVLQCLLLDIVKELVLQCKIITKIYLSENKEVTLFVQLNW